MRNHPSRSKKWNGVALHEAGHAVVALAVYPWVGSLRLIVSEDGGKIGGGTDLGPDEWSPVQLQPGSAQTRQIAWQEALVSLGGAVADHRQASGDRAEIRMAGRGFAFHAGECKTGVYAEEEDFGRVVARLAWLYGRDKVRPQFARAWDEVEQVIHDNWPLVRELSAMLAKAGELDGATVLPWWEAHPKARRRVLDPA